MDLIAEEVVKCCICSQEIDGYGNNPYPLYSEGECCDECNTSVISARLEEIMKGDTTKNEK